MTIIHSQRALVYLLPFFLGSFLTKAKSPRSWTL